MTADLTPELEALIAAVRSWSEGMRIGLLPGARADLSCQLIDAVAAYDESVEPQPIAGYLYGYGSLVEEEGGFALDWDAGDDHYDYVLKGTFVPDERIR